MLILLRGITVLKVRFETGTEATTFDCFYVLNNTMFDKEI